jgi:hypothetical protein
LKHAVASDGEFAVRRRGSALKQHAQLRAQPLAALGCEGVEAEKWRHIVWPLLVVYPQKSPITTVKSGPAVLSFLRHLQRSRVMFLATAA